MTPGRLLRAAALALLPIGLALHLWLGSKAGLGVAAFGLVWHVGAGALGIRWWRRRRRAGDET